MVYYYTVPDFNITLSIKEGLIGLIGVCTFEINPEGKVFLHGELWNGVSDETIKPKEKVRVIDVEGLTLKVEKLNK